MHFVAMKQLTLTKDYPMQRAEIVKHPSVPDNGMAEIYQSMATRQALLKQTGPNAYERISNFVKCRDFLVDSYAFAKENKDFGIYGYKFNGSQLQPDWTGAYLALKFEKAEDKKNFLQNVGY